MIPTSERQREIDGRCIRQRGHKLCLPVRPSPHRTKQLPHRPMVLTLAVLNISAKYLEHGHERGLVSHWRRRLDYGQTRDVANLWFGRN
jgi:hypothetical protein